MVQGAATHLGGKFALIYLLQARVGEHPCSIRDKAIRWDVSLLNLHPSVIINWLLEILVDTSEVRTRFQFCVIFNTPCSILEPVLYVALLTRSLK